MNSIADQFVTPGTRIGSVDDFSAGKGTYVRNNHIYASVVGKVQLVNNSAVIIQQQDQEASTAQQPQKNQVQQSVTPSQQLEVAQDQSLIVPQAGNIVVARVVKIMQQYAKVEIMCISKANSAASAAQDQDNAVPQAEELVMLKRFYPGMIRVQDVRKTETDKLRMIDCFRPGDLVRAQVISLGDQRSYFLSTAKNELGVTFAKSSAGGVMIPVSWQEMQCMKTGMVELRKVAKMQ